MSSRGAVVGAIVGAMGSKPWGWEGSWQTQAQGSHSWQGSSTSAEMTSPTLLSSTPTPC